MDADTQEGEGITVGVRRVHGSPAKRERETVTDEDDAGMQLDESSDGEWFVAMQRLFQEQTEFISPGIPASNNLHGKYPYLPLVLYQPLSNIFVKLQALSQLHSNSSSTVTHISSSGTSNIAFPSGIITQPGPRGFILVNPPQVNMAGSFTQYLEFSGQGNDDV